MVVDDYDRVETGSYNLTLLQIGGSLIAPFPDADQDGGGILSGETLSGQLSTPSDLDGFSFEGMRGRRVRITLTRTSGDFCPDVQLYPPGGGRWICADSCDFGSAAAELDCELTDGGTWTIVVDDYDRVETGDYNLTILQIGGSLVAPFPEPDRDGGGIVSGQTLGGQVGAPSDLDGFSFQGAAGQRVRVTLTRTSSDFCPDVQLYPPGGGGWICADSCDFGSPAAEIDCELTASGTWTIVVDDYDRVETGDYNVSLQQF